VIRPEVLRQLRQYGEDLERQAPGVMAGLYAVGSVALGDFRSGLSNLDVVAVSADAWDEAALRAARRCTRALSRRGQPPRLVCLTWDELAADPADLAPPCWQGQRTLAAGELANPLTWQVMRTAAVCVAGPEYPDVGAGDLREWAAQRLSSWWGPWIGKQGSRPDALLIRRATTERVLEAARLAQVVSSGRVVSKAEAGELALSVGEERFQRILKDAIGFRRGLRASMYWGPFERKRDAIAFIRSRSS